MHHSKIFVYGTLRPSLYPQVLANFNLTSRGMATLRGPFQMLHLGGFPGLIKDFKLPCTNIVGEVIETLDLARCDRYEGCVHGRPNNLYDRQEVAVKMNDGSTLHCWVYIFNHTSQMHNPGGDDAGAPWKVVTSGDWAKR